MVADNYDDIDELYEKKDEKTKMEANHYYIVLRFYLLFSIICAALQLLKLKIITKLEEIKE